MRRLFSIAFVLLSILVATLKIAEWTSEAWWMNAMGFGSAQMLYWRWRVEAFVPACGVWLLVMVPNARLAWHNARWRDGSLPLLGPRALAGRNQISPEDRVRLDSLAHRGEQVFIGLSALLCGMAAANQFDLWVLAFHPPTFGPLDGDADATFLVGVWPALVWAWNAFGVLLAFTLGLVVTIAAFEGVLDFDTRGLHIGDATARHIAFLFALLLMWIGVRCGLAVLGEPINFGWSANGVSGFYERFYTNPTRGFFLVSSPLLAFYFARQAPRGACRPTIVALFWSANAVFLPLMAPSFGRAIQPPSSASLAATLKVEQVQHIAFTRRAWGLDRVQQHQLKVTNDSFPTVPGGTVISAVEPTPGLVVWPKEALRGALHANDTGGGSGREGQGRRPSELYIAREGRALTARIIESDPSATSIKSPLLLESDPSRAGTVSATRRELKAVILQSPQMRNAVSTRMPSWASLEDSAVGPTHARVRELETGAGGGVLRSNALTGLMLALRFGDRSLIEGDTPLTWHLDPLERVQTLAPFVWWLDAKPHPVSMRVGQEKSDRLFWLVEGCFVSRSFPHAAMMHPGDEWSNINYARQSVLGVCDATTGKTDFFLFNPQEPFSRAWNDLLPGFFRPLSELPAPLRAGTRLSQSLLSAQSTIWASYHPIPTNKTSDEVEAWRKNSDEWRHTEDFDTSERDSITQQVIIERGGKPELGRLSAYAPLIGTVIDSAPPTASNSNTDLTLLVALLSARDEGDAIWKGRGQTSFSSWRADKPFLLPLTDQASGGLPSTIFSQFFRKFALVPLLDAKNDCVGLQISHGSAQRQRINGGYSLWAMSNRIASTITRLATVDTAGKTARVDKRIIHLRQLWKSWQEARSNGQWGRVETLEKDITRILSP